MHIKSSPTKRSRQSKRASMLYYGAPGLQQQAKKGPGVAARAFKIKL
jgi:hypothetical protein